MLWVDRDSLCSDEAVKLQSMSPEALVDAHHMTSSSSPTFSRPSPAGVRARSFPLAPCIIELVTDRPQSPTLLQLIFLNTSATSFFCPTSSIPSSSTLCTALPISNVPFTPPPSTCTTPFRPTVTSNPTFFPNPSSSGNSPLGASNRLAIPRLTVNTMPPLSKPNPSLFPVAGSTQVSSGVESREALTTRQ